MFQIRATLVLMTLLSHFAITATENQPVRIALSVKGTAICQLEPNLYSYALTIVSVVSNQSRSNEIFELSDPVLPAEILISRDENALKKRSYEQDSSLDTFSGAPNDNKHLIKHGEAVTSTREIALFVSTNSKTVGHGFISSGSHLLQLRYSLVNEGPASKSGFLVTSLPIMIVLSPPSLVKPCS